MIQVLFVCLGNICRSPLAEGIFADLLNQKRLSKKVSCNSAGTAAYHIGENPDPRTMKIAELNDILINHKGRQFSSESFDEYQYVIVMDRSNLRDVISKGGETGKNVFLMRHFDPANKDADVPDPYYGGKSGFEEMFDILNRSCNGLMKYLMAQHYFDEF